MEKPTVRLATPSDNSAILELMRSLPQQGSIEMLFTKEPDYFRAGTIQGETQQVIVAELDGHLCGMGARTLKKAYINGEPQTLGYLSDLRIASNVRKSLVLREINAFLHGLYQATPAKLHVATIMEDNRPAKVALTWKNKSCTIPNYVDQGRYTTYLIPFLWKKRIFSGQFFGGKSKNIRVVKAQDTMLASIVEFLNTAGREKQFFPVYTKEFFLTSPHFPIHSFYVALDSRDTIIGVCASWKQTPFKQARVQRYNGKMRWLKALAGNLLPAENTLIHYLYGAFIAIHDNEPHILRRLLCAMYNDSVRQGYHFLTLGLHEKDPLNKALRPFIHIKYPSRLYMAEYAGTDAINQMIDSRCPYLELATL